VQRSRRLGYRYVTDEAELRSVRRGKVLGLFANEEMFEHANEGEGDLYDPSVPLRTMSKKALDLLSRDRDGFFLLIEEEGVDEMAHHGNAHLTVKSGAALDRTVALALRFASRTPNTLVVVAGDHETGGLAIESVGEDENPAGEQAEDTIPVAGTNPRIMMEVDFTTNNHTGAATPITAQGPGAQRLGRVLRNTDVHDAILQAMMLRR
jgi:alkaline phosphatase